MKASARSASGMVAACVLVLSVLTACSSGSTTDDEEELALRMGELPPTTTSAAVWPQQVAFCEALRPFAVGQAPLAPADRAERLTSLQDLAPLEWRRILERSAERAGLSEALDVQETSDFAAFTTFAEANCGLDLPDPVTTS